MALYEIWSEGFVVTGQWGYAKFHAKVEGNTFKDACINFAKQNPEFAEYFDKERMTFWACKLYDNEKDARKFENKYIKNRNLKM